jgi:putative intracellular protease/amidase
MKDPFMKKTAYVYILDTMSDWETGYLIAELNTGRYFKKDTEKYSVKTVSLSKEPVKTMGGLYILPDISIEALSPENTDLLILPGGETWMELIHLPILAKTEECLKSGIPVAAICGATIALAKAGLLNNCYHTSNDLNYLKSICPDYSGEALYRNEPATTDGNLITASGTAPLEFTYETLKLLDVFSEGSLEAWYNLNKSHESNYFYKLMESL